MIPRPPSSQLFPYTPLFRSRTFASDPVNPAGSMLDPVAIGHGGGGDPLLQDILMYWGKPF